ncbi:MAG: alpha/beta hydrolase [Deltaproteobacteria bacterium]|nr:alpha/beta hydrolase [Deltaproteobacteria bacterium]
MAKKKRSHTDDLRGATRLAVEATKGVTDVVEAMHHVIGGGPPILGRPLAGAVRLFTAPVYWSIRAVTQLVGGSLDVALAQLAPLLGESAPGPVRGAVIAALNGVLGDHLSESGNPLAIEMLLHHEGHALELEREALRAAIPAATTKALVFVHGSCMSVEQWKRGELDLGGSLARDLGYTPIHVQYNSGLHISTNGRAFDALLEQLVSSWPEPIDELSIVAFSMGGLVTRSACHYADAAGHAWRTKQRKLLFVGTPHHGAPLERGGNWVQVLLGISPYSAPLARLGKIRSAGVTDMRFGNLLDEHWHGRDRFALGEDRRTPVPLPAGVECFAIAGTTAAAERESLPGDGLVPVSSALGRHERPELAVQFSEENQWIGYGMGHLDLLYRAEVYEVLRSWLARSTATP